MFPLESRLNFRVLPVFLIWDHRQPYRLHMCCGKLWLVFPWCRESFQPHAHTYSSCFMRCWKNWVKRSATPTQLKWRKTFTSFRCIQKSSTFLLFSGKFMLGLKHWLTDTEVITLWDSKTLTLSSHSTKSRCHSCHSALYCCVNSLVIYRNDNRIYMNSSYCCVYTTILNELFWKRLI